ncbi:chymase-like [Protopterus annectens]|uniref:chymase-like n=1 Tax=Protopterus annectens TaxID=7888 RepID=UPI001CFABFF2|nr:chymase-like [Protopterus annectens]
MQPLLCGLFLMCCLTRLGAHNEGIIGGHEARPHSKPYMAFVDLTVGINVNDSCGGFLVKENFVITAAHCKGKATVILGAHNIYAKEKTQQVIKVVDYIRHENYTTPLLQNDIMLLKLERKAKLTKQVQIIKLPRNNEDIASGIKCNVAGWGRVNAASSSISSTLQEVDMYIMDRKICKEKEFKRVDDTVLCVGNTKNNKTTFKGDSGSPLVCSGIAQGIVSHGLRGKPVPPRIFTRINKYLDWIKKKMT